jgi:hypothetical protein
MDPVAPCELVQVELVAPVVEVEAPGYVLVAKSCIDPVSQAVTEYCEPTRLRVRLSTNPPSRLKGRAALTGNGLHRIVIDPSMVQLGVLTPLPQEEGPGWMIAAGVLAHPLEFWVQARTPSMNHGDIEFVLTLEPTAGQQVAAPARQRMTAVELTLHIDDCARRPQCPVPRPLSAHAKVFDSAVVVADSAAMPLARTKMTLMRATPFDFPGRLVVAVQESDRAHVILCADEYHHDGGQRGHEFTQNNLHIPASDGVSFYVQGLRVTGDDPVSILVRVANGHFGDYVNLFVAPQVAVRWGVAWAYPACAPQLLPDSVQEGDDRAADLCSAELIIDTAGFPPGTAAKATIHRCNADRRQVVVPGLDALTVNPQGQVMTGGGLRPAFSSTNRLGSWRPWNAPYFSFSADFPDHDVSRSTPGDPVAQPALYLKQKYLHAFVIDSSAPELEPVPCRNQILSHIKAEHLDAQDEALAAQVLSNHRFLRPNFVNTAGGFNEWLGAVKNTYAYFHFCHGGYGGTPGTDNFFCSFRLGRDSINFTHLRQHRISDGGQGKLDFPRHLMFLASCHSAWDPRLARELIANRPDCYVIGFRRTIKRATVQAMAGRFFHEWLVLRGGDPAAIPACYDIASADHAAVEPRLFHKDSDFSLVP